MSRLWSAGKQEEAETLFSRVAASAWLRAVLQIGRPRPRPATGEQCRKCWAGLGWAGLGWAGLGWAGLLGTTLHLHNAAIPGWQLGRDGAKCGYDSISIVTLSESLSIIFLARG